MNELIVKEDERIENLIYELRGKQVMLDSDLAVLYGCSNGTKVINQAVKRNLDRFPEDFYFQLTREEYNDIMKYKNINSELGKHSKYYPFAFTEQGVAMLASVLKTEMAAKVSVNIMRAFVLMRRYISSNIINSGTILMNHESRILTLEESFAKLGEKSKANSLFYEGQIYDAYSLLLDILNKSNKNIIIIDNYAGKELLDLLKNINKDITIVSKNIDETTKEKYLKQYNNVKFIDNNTFHDRFIIVDEKTL